MSIEIAKRNYHFMDFKSSYTFKSSCGIYANYLHDLESIFWILVWTLFVYRKDSAECADSESTHKQKTQGEELFLQDSAGLFDREQFLTSKENFDTKMESIPEYFGNLKVLITTFKDHLLDYYCEGEKNITLNGPIKPTEGSVHNSILEAFKSYGIPDGDAGFKIIPVDPPRSLKRSTPDEVTDEKPVKRLRSVCLFAIGSRLSNCL